MGRQPKPIGKHFSNIYRTHLAPRNKCGVAPSWTVSSGKEGAPRITLPSSVRRGKMLPSTTSKNNWFRGLPQDVQKLLQNKLEGKSALETAQMANQHFDQQGRPLNSETSISSISAENDIPPTTPQLIPQQPDQSNDINAVSSRQSRPASGGNNNRYTPAFASSSQRNNSRPRTRSRPRSQPNRSSSEQPTTPAGASGGEMNLCRLHRDDQSSNTCVGPNCPSHHSATSCWSRSCKSHSGQGNGRGGRR